jgi:DNA-binding XRE family transcriptional regulator
MTATKPSSRAQRWITSVDGHRLRRLRRQRGLAQEQLADLASVSLTTAARLERQHKANCRTWTQTRIAAALGEQFANLGASTTALPSANGPLMAQKINKCPGAIKARGRDHRPGLGSHRRSG